MNLTQERTLPLEQVVIGIADHAIYQRLNDSFSETRIAHDLLLTSLQSSQEAKILCAYGEPCPEALLKFLKSAGSEDAIKILHTAPFQRGHIAVNTEINVIYVPKTNVKKTNIPVSLQACVPLVSHFLNDGIGHHKVICQVVSDEEYSKVRLSSFINSDDEIECIDADSVFISLTLAHRWNLMDGSLVKVRLKEEHSTSHIMKLKANSQLHDGAVMSRLSWYNIDGKPISTNAIVIKTLPIEDNYQSYSSDTKSLLKSASQVTVARVAECPIGYQTNHIPDLSAYIKQYFKTERYLKVSDVFSIDCTSLIGEKLTLTMTIVKIDKSCERNLTFIINHNTALYEGISTNSFIPPEPSTDQLLYFANIIHPFKEIISPFIKYNWRCSPTPLILLAGSHGSGVSKICHHISKLFQLNYMEMNSTHLVADTVNSTEIRMKDLFTRCSAFSPILLHLRNIHVISKDEPSNTENTRLTESFIGELVTCVENSKRPLIVVGSCDRIKTVPAGIRDICLHEITVKTPNKDDRELMIKSLLDGSYLDPLVDVHHIAEHTAGFLYGDLKAMVEIAKRKSILKAEEACKREYGRIDSTIIKAAGSMITKSELNTSLTEIQKTQSKDLGAPKIPNVLWEDIGGLEQVKSDILDTIQLPLDHPELFRSGLKRSGILLYGPPGTGKTLLAKAVATECSLNFFSVKGPELINMYVGQSEENVRMVFHKARSAAPCVVFFDELDSLAPARGRTGDSGGVLDRVVSQLLAELDGLHKSADVFVIGATNRPDLLDSALLRPGRFDKMVFVNVSSSPDQHLNILKAITRKFTVSESCDLQQVSELCPTYMSGADLYAVCSNAVTNAIMRYIEAENFSPDQVIMELNDFKMALNDFRPSVSESDIQEYSSLNKLLTAIVKQ